MPWEVTIINAEDRRKPLGERDDVIARFAAVLPGTILQPAHRPDPEVIAQMSLVLREHLMRKPQLNADFDGNDFSMQFYADDCPMIEAVGAEIRGNGNPIPALAALCQTNGWSVVNAADGALVDLTASDAPEWSAFRTWRHHALAAIKAAGS